MHTGKYGKNNALSLLLQHKLQICVEKFKEKMSDTEEG
jgi:hypothetical protein